MEFKKYINPINQKTSNPMDDEYDRELNEKEYVPFLINRSMSYFVDTIMQANEVNKISHTDKKMQYDYLYHGIKRKKRFSKWEKAEKSDLINSIVTYYGYSKQKAREVLPLLDVNVIKQIQKKLDRGGK